MSVRNLPLLPFFLKVICLPLLLGACATLPPPVAEDGNYVDPIGGAFVTDNPTLYSGTLNCLASEYAQKTKLSIAVGRITDSTNTTTATDGGFITDGASLMLISALAKAGISQVERYDMQVAKDDIKYAMDKLLGHPDEKQFKKLVSGRVRSADYYIVGGISELNFNIRANSGEIKISELGLGMRYAVLNIAMDLRLVQTETLEIARVVSMQKQILGRELKGGLFDFIGSKFTVALLDSKSAEPVQLGVRTVIERAVIDLLSPLYGVDPRPCLVQSGHAAEAEKIINPVISLPRARAEKASKPPVSAPVVEPDRSDMLPASLAFLAENRPWHLLLDQSRSRLYVYRNQNGTPELDAEYPVHQEVDETTPAECRDASQSSGIFYIAASSESTQPTVLAGAEALPKGFADSSVLPTKRARAMALVTATQHDSAGASELATACRWQGDLDLTKLQPYISLGHRFPLVVTPAVEWLETSRWQAQRESLQRAFSRWLADWQSLSNESYMSHYSSEQFSDGNLDFEQWKTYKGHVNDGKKFIKVDVSNHAIFVYPGVNGLILMRFDQHYQNDVFSTDADKKIVWRREGDHWKIIYEGIR